MHGDGGISEYNRYLPLYARHHLTEQCLATDYYLTLITIYYLSQYYIDIRYPCISNKVMIVMTLLENDSIIIFLFYAMLIIITDIRYIKYYNL